MKRSAMVLAAAMAAMLLAPFAAPAEAAQDKPPEKAAPVKLEKADLDRGMKEAPAVQTASGQPCEITGAAFRGQGTQKGADGKSQKVTIYETACQSGLGYILVSPQGGTPQAFDCLAAASSSTVCALPANADPKKGLVSLAAAAGTSCQVSDGRYLGNGKDNMTYYEVACGAQPGYVLARPVSGTPLSTPCAGMAGTPLACTLTSKTQIIAGLQPVAQASGKACQVSDARFIGASKTGEESFYEFGCGPQPGFIAIVDKGGKFKQAIECSHAQSLGGCKFTDAASSVAADNASYAAAAAKAGYACQVSQSRYIGTDRTGRDVVELACSNRPDGAIMLTSKTGGATDVLDCGRAGYAGGQSCQLTQAGVVYPKYTQALRSKGKTSCTVSGTAFLGTAGQNEQFVETTCADGKSGWVIGFNGGSFTPVDILSCPQAKGRGLPCKMTGNIQ